MCRTNFDQDDDYENSSLLSNGTCCDDNDEEEYAEPDSAKFTPKFEENSSWSEDIPIVQAKTDDSF